MANAFYGNTLYCDTVGIVSKTPVVVKAICFYPNTQADAIGFDWWDEANAVSASDVTFTATASTGTITDDDADHNIMTSAAFPAGSVVKVLSTSGSATYKTYHLIGTAGNNDRFIITPTSTWGDEASKNYHVIVYPNRVAFRFKQPFDTNEQSLWFPIPGGLRLPNLVLASISSTCSSVVYIE